MLIFTCGLAFSQTKGQNIHKNTTIDTLYNSGNDIDSCTLDSMQNIAPISDDVLKEHSAGIILLILAVVVIIIGIWILVSRKKKEELIIIDTLLKSAESAIIARQASKAERELGEVIKRIKESDTLRKKKVIELQSRLDILKTNIRFDTCAEKMDSALNAWDINAARSEWAKIKDLRVVDNVRKAKKDELSLQLDTIKKNLEIDSHLKLAETALIFQKAITAAAELDIARKLLSNVSDKSRKKKFEDLSERLKKLETDIKNENEVQLEQARQEVESGRFTDIESVKKKVLPTIGREAPKEVQNAAKAFVGEVEERYKKGIIPEQTLDYVLYDASRIKTPNKEGYYCSTIFPPQNTILYPFRRKKVERRGYMEEFFLRKLSDAIAAYPGLMVLGDVSILTKSGEHPFEPDIAIVENKFIRGFRIDIEIDEPYTGYERKPIHYIGCGDNYRDQILVNRGWIVVRFSEKQIYQEFAKCIAYIKHLISCVLKGDDTNYDYPTYDKKWTENEARILSVQKYREKLLKHEFGQIESAPLDQKDMQQTDVEKKASIQVKAISYDLKINTNLDNSYDSYPQDNYITFDPAEHIYLYKGQEFASVSTIVSKFFREFNPIENAIRVAGRGGVSIVEIMERWDAEGAESREVGTFMHAQIESILNHQNPLSTTHFKYSGHYVKKDRDISIEAELRYFQSFMREHQIHPYRTEWRICDEAHQIAGTIDLLCRNGQDFEIYDWKRSRKAQPDETIWAYGIHGLERTPDIAFYHYALQQNIYRYILEKNYGIHVSKMHIVVFHPNYDSYKLYDIPRMNDEVRIILSNMSNL